MPHMEVIGDGYDDEDVSGDVMGDVMGYGGPMGDYEGEAMVVGYTDEGYPIVEGARGRRLRRRRHNVSVVKPGWRATQLAPGVIAPDQGLLSLPMQGIQGNTFTATILTITFQGELQKPFRGERLLVTTVRTGTSAVGRLLGNIYVGTDLQQLDISAVDLEQLGAPGAFGVRLTMKPAQPGVKIRIVTTLSAAVTASDTIFTSVQLLGRLVH
jgi:hypothetical protein